VSVEQRIARLESIEAIKQLKSQYFHACDTKQADAVRECFAQGVIDLRYGRVGQFTDREQLVSVFSELACQPHIVEMHHGQNPRITMESADRAQGHFGLYYHMIDTRRETVTQLAGFYDDGFVCVGDRWYIERSHYEVTSTQIYDLSEGLAKVIFAGVAAPQSLDDPTQQAG